MVQCQNGDDEALDDAKRHFGSVLTAGTGTPERPEARLVGLEIAECLSAAPGLCPELLAT